MNELNKLKQLLDDLLIGYEAKCKNCILLIDDRATIWLDKDGLRVFGWGFSGQWPYSAEFLAKAFDRKFKEEMGR